MDANKTGVKTKRFSTLYVFFLCGLLAAAPIAHAGLSGIILSEIQITGSTGHSDDDFVELYNPNSAPIDISGYRLRYRNSGGTENSLNKIKDGTCIAANEYYLWANSNGIFAGIADTKTGTGLSAKYSLALMLPENAEHPLVDSVSWENSYPFDASAFKFSSSPKANESMVRDIATGAWLPGFSSSPTPTKSASTTCPDIPPPALPAPDPTPPVKTVRLNEIFPNPKARGDAGEFIELYNSGEESVDISGWTLHDATKTGAYAFPAGTIIAASTFLAATDRDFTFSLNNSDETVSLFDSAGILIDTMHYETAKDDVSLNYTSSGWRGGTPTPGAANIVNNLPETREKVPKKGYRGMPIVMTAKGKDADHDKLNYVWDFGDGHKSYKSETSHTYEEKGEYAITLKTTDGVEDTLETYTIRIEAYKPPDVRIVSFVPNPDGNDTGNEWIALENREKKEVNLKSFSIATGWKKLVNHPIREDLIIGAKQTARLTHDNAAFTLPNQKGRIEFRAPGGKAIQDIKYKLEKPAAEDAVYVKKKGERWKLTANRQPAKNNQEKSAPIPEESPQKLPDASMPDAQPAPVEEAPSIPDEEKEIPEQETFSSSVVRNDAVTEDPDRPKLSDLLNYGLSLHLPKAITYMPHDEIPITPAAPKPKAEERSVDTLFIRINAFINAWENGV